MDAAPARATATASASHTALEASLGWYRLIAAALVALVALRFPPDIGAPVAAAVGALAVSGLAAPALAAFRPFALARPSVRFGIFGGECLAAATILAVYSSETAAAWVVYVPVVASGAARWHARGALLGLGAFVAADLPVEATTPPTSSSGALLAVRFGFLGMVTAFAAVQSRFLLQLRTLQDSDLRLRRSEARLRGVLDSVADGIITFDERGWVEELNPAAEELFGVFDREASGRRLRDLVVRDGGDAPLLQGSGEATGRRQDGLTFPLDYTVGEMRLDDRRVFIASVRDATERHAHTLALEHEATHDALTGLYNRPFFRRRIDHLLGARESRPFAVLLMDVNRFKEINDSLGHRFGDILLQQIAARIRRTVREVDTLARLGGDEFGVLLVQGSVEVGADRVARDIVASMRQPYVIDGNVLDAGLSIGVATFPEHGESGELLLRRADVAMYAAKRARSGFAVYDQQQDAGSAGRLALTGELRHALVKESLELHYQPKVNLADSRTMGVEALLRWRHPTRGLIPPEEFIAIAEDTDLIEPLTDWLLATALRQLRSWRDLGIDIHVAVNLSPRNVADRHLARRVGALLARAGVPAQALRLEITEGSMLAASAANNLAALHALGVGLSVDDFGVGYSSLAYLRRLPVNELKIDRSFVSDMVGNHDNAAIVRSTIELGHELGLQVVAEGIEDQPTLALLIEMGCDGGQGHHLGRPVSAARLVRWLRESPWGVRQPYPGRADWSVRPAS